jgi:hypothetical protein
MRSIHLLAIVLILITSQAALADPPSGEVIQQTIAAVGGEAKLLKLFRIKERLVINENPEAKGSERVSVLEPPLHWWLGKKERVQDEKEPAIFLVWAWTLGPLVDPKSQLESLPEITINDRPAYGIRISGSIDPPMVLYFDKETRFLARIDWRKDQNVLSDWRDLDGLKYPARCSGYRSTGKAWYHTEILSIERLSEVPPELKR